MPDESILKIKVRISMKQLVTHLVKKLSAFNETRRFNTVFTKARHLGEYSPHHRILFPWDLF